jgi:hypothetical protein
MKQKVAPLSRKNDIVVQDLNGEVLIYDLKLNKAFCLNETSALVWQACDGNKSVDEISRSISKQMNQPANDDLVWLALDQLKQENLLENSEEVVANFDGMSRREVIRKIGLGTMIALPFVTGLIAPTAAQAQSLAAICAATACDCADAFGIPANAGVQCTGVNLITPCGALGGAPAGSAACRCFSSGSALGQDVCAP